FVAGTDAVQDLLARPVGQATVADVLDDVVVHRPGTVWVPVDGLFDPAHLLGRLQRLAVNLVRVAKPKLDLTELSLALVESPPASGNLGVELIPKSRYEVGGDDVTVAIEFDSSWIEKDPVPDPGLLVRLLH